MSIFDSLVTPEAQRKPRPPLGPDLSQRQGGAPAPGSALGTMRTMHQGDAGRGNLLKAMQGRQGRDAGRAQAMGAGSGQMALAANQVQRQAGDTRQRGRMDMEMAYLDRSGRVDAARKSRNLQRELRLAQNTHAMEMAELNNQNRGGFPEAEDQGSWLDGDYRSTKVAALANPLVAPLVGLGEWWGNRGKEE
jgi:hypothetical protein